MQTDLIEKLYNEENLTDSELKALIENRTPEDFALLSEKARKRCEQEYQNQVFMRGLI